MTFTVNVVGSISTNGMTTVMKGRSAVGMLQGGAASSHTFDVTADFSVNGVHTLLTSSDVQANCAFQL